jgi:hypothetical protein
VTLATLAERIGTRSDALAVILREEVERGRVVRTANGGYALVSAAFAPGTLSALRDLDWRSFEREPFRPPLSSPEPS